MPLHEAADRFIDTNDFVPTYSDLLDSARVANVRLAAPPRSRANNYWADQVVAEPHPAW